MGLSCGMSCLRVLLFAFNFIFWLLGVAVLGVGIWSRVSGTGSWESLVTSTPNLTAANMMIAAGVIVAIIGFLGCCGAIKKSPCMLISYAICIFLIFILELAAGIYAYTKRDSIQRQIEKSIQTTIRSNYNGTTKAQQGVTEGIDWFQENVKCCGSAKPADWLASGWYIKSGQTRIQVPTSCCKKKKTGCNSGAISFLLKAKKIYAEGCVPAVKRFMKDNMHLMKIGAVAIAIGVIELLGIVFACCLCRAIKEEDHHA